MAEELEDDSGDFTEPQQVANGVGGGGANGTANAALRFGTARWQRAKYLAANQRQRAGQFVQRQPARADL